MSSAQNRARKERDLTVQQQVGIACGICNHVIDGLDPGFVRLCDDCANRGRKRGGKAAAIDRENLKLDILFDNY